MAKRFNTQNYYVELPNRQTLNLYCWSTPSRNYACVRHCWNPDSGLEVRETIYNRPWESFDYESTIKMLCRKMDKNHFGGWSYLIDEWCKAEATRQANQANAFVAAFTKAYDGLTDDQKQKLADSDIMLNSKEDAESMLKLLQVTSIVNHV